MRSSLPEVCKVCGLPKDICVCDVLETEKRDTFVTVSVKKAKFRKFVTVIKMQGFKKEKIKQIMKELKRKLACGGTVKDDEIVLQGDHKNKIKDLLVKFGIDEEIIEIV